MKKRIQETLEEEEHCRCTGLNEDLSTDQQLLEIQTALTENQKEHDKFRTCHIELEDAQRQASYAHEYSIEELKLRISKKAEIFERKTWRSGPIFDSGHISKQFE